MPDLNKRTLEALAELHKIPEVGFQEVKTAAFLAAALEKAGYQVQTGLGGTGVTGLLPSGRPGPTVALRADMDALAHEVGGQNCAIHSCGHDAHCAMVLTAAEEIARRGIAKGALKIIFQPGEEVLFGALKMIEAGAIDDVDMILGLHLRPIQEAKGGEATPGLFPGASCRVKALIEGVTAHGARPHLGVNAIDAAAAAICAVNAIRTDPLIPSSIKTTQINGGGPAANAIPAKAELIFDLRSQKNPVMDSMVAKVKTSVSNAAAAIGATASLEVLGGCPAAEYDEDMVALFAEAIEAVIGKDGLLPPITTPGAEDFHNYKQKKPGLKAAYMGLGVNLAPGLHHPEMRFEPEFLLNGVNILLYSVKKLLGSKADA
jgi:amidohydrolase